MALGAPVGQFRPLPSSFSVMLPSSRPARRRPLFPALVALALLVLPLRADDTEDENDPDDEEPPPAQNVGEEREVGLMPELTTALPGRDFDTDSSPFVIDLRNHFTIPGVNSSQLVQFRTSLGTINAELLVADAPLTVANFKSYLATDSTSAADRLKTYDGTFIHRAAENYHPWFGYLGEFVIQGGGYRIDSSLSELPKKAPVVNEFKVANSRGTIAMAKMGGQPNSATSEWFINMDENRETLGTDNNAGFTVFARILGKGMDVADAIADLPSYDLREYLQRGEFGEVPLRDVKPNQSQLFFSNLVAVDTVRMVPLQPPGAGGASVLTYSIANDNPAAATATVVNGVLTVVPGTLGGRSIITVRALEAGGGFTESTLVTTRVGPPILIKALPGTTTAALGDIVRIRAEITAWPLNIKWQRRASTNVAWEDLADEGLYSGSATQDLFINLSADTTEKAAASLALSGSQYRFIVTNTINGVTRTLEGKPTTLRVIPTLAFRDKLAKTTTASLGTAAVTLIARADPATLPAPVYQWERKAPGSTTWEPIADARAAIPADGDTPAQPAVLSPYSGVNTPFLTIRLNGTTPASGTGISTAATLALDRSQYRCVIRHDRGAGPLQLASTVTTLRITTLRVGFAAQPPALVARQLGSSATISVTSLPVAANTPVAYQWQRLPAGAHPRTGWVNVANSTEQAPTRYTGATTRTLTINLAGADDTAKLAALALNDDLYRCVITVPALGSATSSAARLRVYAQAFTLVTHQSQSLPGLGAAEGRHYSVAGLPKGLSFAESSGTISGTPTAKPGLYRITVTIRQDGAVTGTQVYWLEIRALSGNNAGGFEALLTPDADSPPHAKFAITVNHTGAFTGTLTTAIEKSPLPFRGVVVRSTSGELTLAAPIDIKRPGAPAGRTYRLSGLTISSAGVLSVTLSARESATAELVELADTTTGVRLSTYSANNPAPWANVDSYNFVLTSPTPLAEPGDEDPPHPAGSGYAIVPVGRDGRLSFRGKLADGSKFTASLVGATDRSFRLFLRPHGAAPGAYLSAYLPLSIPSADYPRHSIRGDAGQDAYWAKPALPKSTNYRDGFGPLGLTVKLEPWFPSRFSDFGVVETSNENRGLIDLVLFGADLGASAGEVPGSLSVTYKLPVAAMLDAVQPDASKFTGKLDTRTGLITGSFVIVDPIPDTNRTTTRRVPFEGTLFMVENQQNGTINAEGFTLVPAAPGAQDRTSRSGRLQLKQPGTPPAP